MAKDTKISLKQALGWIVLSTLLVSGSACLGLLYHWHVKTQRGLDPHYQIIAMMQTCSEKEALKTVFLAELLDLSIDHPTNLYHFNSREAVRKLRACPLINQAEVLKVSPGMVYVDYALRQPIAYLGNYSNTVIDKEGVTFPYKQFFTPKKLPEIYLGLDDNIPFKWGIALEGKEMELAFRLLKVLTTYCCHQYCTIQRIDVAHAYSPSYGQRQIVIIMEDRIEKSVDGKTVMAAFPQILRLSTENYAQELANYLTVRQFLIKKENQKEAVIIDLRIPHLAFLKD